MVVPFFDKSSISESQISNDVGRKPERPFIIRAMLKETSLGDLACLLTVAATIKNQFDFAELHVRYRNIRPYSEQMITLVPSVDSAVGIRPYLPTWARLGLADSRLWRPMARAIDGNKGSWGSFCDLLLSDWMLNHRCLHGIPNPVPLQIPEAQITPLSSQLTEAGLAPDRWFATLHYRASSYLNKNSGKLRNSDPQEIDKLINFIIDDLDGQVVQLGHPELTPFSPRAGLVDLSRVKDNFLSQAFAISRSRFMIGGPSGPSAVAWCFQVPTAIVDATDGVMSWGPEEHVLFSHEVTTPDGRVLRNQALHDAGLLEYRILRDKIRANEAYSVRKNNAEELIRVAKHMHKVTSEFTAWRPPAPTYSGPKPNHIVWPPQTNKTFNFLDI